MACDDVCILVGGYHLLHVCAVYDLYLPVQSVPKLLEKWHWPLRRNVSISLMFLISRS